MSLEDLRKLRLENDSDRVAGGRRTALKFRVGLLIGLLAVGGFFAQRWRAQTGADRASSATTADSGASELVAGKKLESEPGGRLTVAGYIVPRQKVELGAKIIGRVEFIAVDVGDLVKKGQIVARLESQEFQAQLEQAEADLEVVKKKFSDLVAGSRQQEIRQAQAQLEQDEASYQVSRVQLERIQRLFQDGLIAAQELDAARTEYAVRQAKLKQARENRDLGKEGPRAQAVEVAKAEIKQAAMRVEYYKTQLRNTVIESHIDGVVTERLVQVGEVVAPGVGNAPGVRTSIVRIASMEGLRVEADINETDIGRLRLNQSAEIVLDGVAGKTYHGTLVQVWPEANRQKGTVKIQVALRDADALCRPEMSARVTFLSTYSVFGERVQSH